MNEFLHEWRLSTVDWLSGWWSRDNGGDICWWWSDVEVDSETVVERESVVWVLLSNLDEKKILMGLLRKKILK